MRLSIFAYYKYPGEPACGGGQFMLIQVWNSIHLEATCFEGTDGLFISRIHLFVRCDFDCGEFHSFTSCDMTVWASS